MYHIREFLNTNLNPETGSLDREVCFVRPQFLYPKCWGVVPQIAPHPLSLFNPYPANVEKMVSS